MTDRREMAEQLLEAQVRFFEAQLEPPQFGALLERELDHLLAGAGQLTLGQVVTREQITAVALKYAVAMKIPGAVPELASEIAERIYRHPAQDDNRLHDVIAARHIEAFTSKLLTLPLVQERLIESPLMIEIVSEWLYRVATETAAHNRELAGRIPGLSSLLGTGGSLLGRVAPDASVELDTRLRELASQTARVVLRSAKGTANPPDEPWLQETVLECWREQADAPVGALRDYLTQEDLEDLIVLFYDLWLSLRKTDYVHALIREGVGCFFDKYEAMTLLGLLEEFGITRADLIEEAHRFAPPIIEVLRDTGMLSAVIRRQLEPFFHSDLTQSLLASQR